MIVKGIVQPTNREIGNFDKLLFWGVKKSVSRFAQSCIGGGGVRCKMTCKKSVQFLVLGVLQPAQQAFPFVHFSRSNFFKRSLLSILNLTLKVKTSQRYVS